MKFLVEKQLTAGKKLDGRGNVISEKLIQSPSKKAFEKNITTEVKAGKPVNQTVAIAKNVQNEHRYDEDLNVNGKMDSQKIDGYTEEEILTKIAELESIPNPSYEERLKLNRLKDKLTLFESRSKNIKLKEEDLNDKFIYLFPVDMLTNKDKKILDSFDLKFIGKKDHQGEMFEIVKGTKKDLKEYADEYLDYKLHQDYLYHEEDFDEDILKESLEKLTTKQLEENLNEEDGLKVAISESKIMLQNLIDNYNEEDFEDEDNNLEVYVQDIIERLDEIDFEKYSEKDQDKLDYVYDEIGLFDKENYPDFYTYKDITRSLLRTIEILENVSKKEIIEESKVLENTNRFNKNIIKTYLIPHVYKEGTDVDELIIFSHSFGNKIMYGYETGAFGSGDGYKEEAGAFEGFRETMDEEFMEDWGLDWTYILVKKGKEEEAKQEAADKIREYNEYHFDEDILKESLDKSNFEITSYGWNDDSEQFTDIEFEEFSGTFEEAKQIADKMINRLYDYYDGSYVEIKENDKIVWSSKEVIENFEGEFNLRQALLDLDNEDYMGLTNMYDATNLTIEEKHELINLITGKGDLMEIYDYLYNKFDASQGDE